MNNTVCALRLYERAMEIAEKNDPRFRFELDDSRDWANEEAAEIGVLRRLIERMAQLNNPNRRQHVVP